MMYLIFFFFSFSLTAIENYVLIGPPGSGKGTFSIKMIEEEGYKQIGVGDIVRSHIKRETELGKLIKPIVQRGDYKDMVCDKCESKLEVRIGDTIENIPKRLAYYRNTIKPLINLAQKEYKVICCQ